MSIDDLSDDLLIRILWHSERPVSFRSDSDILWGSLWPVPKYIASNSSTKKLLQQEKTRNTPFPTPPAITDAALSLRIAAVCRRWRRVAQRYVSTLLVRENLAVSLEDLSTSVACFPNLTHLHLCDGSVVTINDDFLAYLASSCPKLTAFHVGKNIMREESRGAYRNIGLPFKEKGYDDDPVTTAGLDSFLRQCSQLEHLSLFCIQGLDTLPPSFFQLASLQGVALTTASAIQAPEFTNLSSLTALSLEPNLSDRSPTARVLDGHDLMNLVSMASLTSISFCDDAPVTLGNQRSFTDDPHSPISASGSESSFSFALLSSLKSLRFKPAPEQDSSLMFSSGSPCSSLERLYFSNFNQHNFKGFRDNIADLLPRLQELSLDGCSLWNLPDHFTSLRCLQTLKILRGVLVRLPENFGELPALKTLVLHMLPIIHLPDSFCQLSSLETFIMIRCDLVPELPPGFGSLTSLKTLCLNLPPNLILPDDIGSLVNLETWSFTQSEDLLPWSFTQLSSLTRLELDECLVAELPHGISAMCALRELYLRSCDRISQIPEALTACTKLEVLRVEYCSRLVLVPRRLDGLVRLKQLELFKCELLSEFPATLPSSLEVLVLGNFQQVTPLPDISMLSWLQSLRLTMVTVDADFIPGISRGLAHLKHLELLLEGADEFPFPLTFMSLLRTLTIWTTGHMKKLPDDLGEALQQLRQLEIHHAGELEELPDTLTNLQDLRVLKINFAPKLLTLPEGIGALTRLRKLDLANCSGLQGLPASFTRLSCLTDLVLRATSIRSLPAGFGQLTRLKELNLKDCGQLRSLPKDFPELKMLHHLKVNRRDGGMYGLVKDLSKFFKKLVIR